MLCFLNFSKSDSQMKENYNYSVSNNYKNKLAIFFLLYNNNVKTLKKSIYFLEEGVISYIT